ncbi:MAG: hypothetical protein HC945_02680 [Nitrosarchaeum sp.]|nr:hypothetical protein [Nitrosarchaeum sp.]
MNLFLDQQRKFRPGKLSWYPGAKKAESAMYSLYWEQFNPRADSVIYNCPLAYRFDLSTDIKLNIRRNWIFLNALRTDWILINNNNVTLIEFSRFFEIDVIYQTLTYKDLLSSYLTNDYNITTIIAVYEISLKAIQLANKYDILIQIIDV